MLQRLAGVTAECRATSGGRAAVDALLASFPRGAEFAQLGERLSGVRIRKRGGRLYAEVSEAEA